MTSLLLNITLMKWALFLAGASCLIGVGVALYRLFLHPLASVPGPRLAALSRLYALYFNTVKEGRFYLEIERLHQVYGPVVRIAPNEIHLADPENYDKIYAVGSKFYKDPVFYNALSTEDFPGIFATISNETHRRRRAPLEPFFSRRTILQLEDIAQDKAAKLCRLVDSSVSKGQWFDIYAAFRAVSVDVITEYAFDDCWGQLDREDLGEWFTQIIRNGGVGFWMLQQFPFLLNLLDTLPPTIARRLSPEMSDMLNIQDKFAKLVEDIRSNMEAGHKPRRRTIVHNLIEPVPGHRQLSAKEMAAEAFSFCAAASDTTGNALTVAAYHVIINPDIYRRLREELEQAFPDSSATFAYTKLEKMPYLTGVIKEGLRLSYGVIGRLPRVTPTGGAVFNGYSVPEGTVVGMSSYMLHRDPNIFPNPIVFAPERWIGENLKPTASKYLVPFSSGSRGCIGQNLAWCELYVTLGTLFRIFGNLTAKDVGELTYVDYFNPFHPEEQQKLKVFKLDIEEGEKELLE